MIMSSMTSYEDRARIQSKVRYLIFRNTAAESLGCAQTSYSPRSLHASLCAMSSSRVLQLTPDLLEMN